MTADDPCRTGRAQCGEHSSCVVEGLNFKCVCDRGSENDYREEAFEAQNALNVANCVGLYSNSLLIHSLICELWNSIQAFIDFCH